MDREIFFKEVRASKDLFGGKMNQTQVDGLNNLLAVWFEEVEPQYGAENVTDHLAYDLGTAFHETGATMQPITERGSVAYFDKYEPGTDIGKRLGNTQKGDGYRYRGEGHVQNTGRRNARFASQRLNELFGLGVDLEANPQQRGDPRVSALSLFIGNRDGWWTGKRLGQYLVPDNPDWENARRVVNGTDKAKEIAKYAKAFKKAIQDASGVA